MLYPSPCAVALPQSLASIKVAGEKKTSVVQVSTGVEELCGCGGQANATSGGSKAGGTASGARLGECNYKTAWRLALDNIGPNEFTTTVKKVSRQEREAWCGEAACSVLFGVAEARRDTQDAAAALGGQF